jgi:hypothetical protein
MFGERERDPVGLSAAERRNLFRQVVDDNTAMVGECAVIEGKPYGYLLRLCTHFSESKLYKKKDEKAHYESIKTRPDLFRGHVVTVERCVIIEVGKPEPLPASDFTVPGYTVMEALTVNRARELYALRIVAPKGSEAYARLRKGIRDRKNPVLRVTGFFMKAYAKRDSKGDIWREPLLIAPVPKFSKVNATYDVMEDLEEGRMAHLLPSVPITVPGAHERMIVEILPGQNTANGQPGPPRMRVDGKLGLPGAPTLCSDGLQRLIGRLPEKEKRYPSAVVVLTEGAPREPIKPVLKALRNTGLKRIYFKDENQKLLPGVR